MTILLLGRWDHAGNLTVEETVEVNDDQDEDDRQAEMDAIVDAQDNEDNMAWACSYLVDTPEEAMRDAYEEYVQFEGGKIIDNT
ncbi:hypothetical protein [Streptomyces sp. NPDC047097]|uniref:hypothetical protein n=1 Tax=Streptomyces sp. NPDC047097 TaxID=3155260 RepID=UPI00340F0EDC